ncbi:hypothetical protein PG985_005516 [Apiospora marii]|uniref:uncharacterized protein n=1 Tax=Apiospora marii TaxID=335849 RepID=UPI00312E6AE1
MPSRPKPHEDAWKRPAKVAANIDKLLFELQDCQPKNTTKTYRTRQLGPFWNYYNGCVRSCYRTPHF